MTDREAVWREISAMLNPDPRAELPQPNFTTMEMAELSNTPVKTVRERALRLLKQGKLGGKKIQDGGHEMWVFWKTGTGRTAPGVGGKWESTEVSHE